MSKITTEVKDGVIQYQVGDVGGFSLELGKCHADVIQKATVQGMVQRMSNVAAAVKSGAEGKLAAMQSLADHYASGAASWSQGRAANVERRATQAQRAIAKVFGTDQAGALDIVTKVAAKHEIDEKAAEKMLVKSDKVAAVLATMRVKRGAKPVISTDTLL